MALFTPSASPAVVIKEIDLTGGVPNVQSTTGAFVGDFKWGPAYEPTLVSNEADLIDVFGSPDSSNAADVISASYFLRYSSALQVVRVIDASAKNSVSSGTAIQIDNEKDFEDTQQAALDGSNIVFAARYAGELGNSLKVEICPSSDPDTDSDNGGAFRSWAYKNEFPSGPGTSPFASERGAKGDEYHVAVIDQDGLITGTKNTVLETYAHVSLARNAINNDGTSNYGVDVINNKSNFIYQAGFGTGVFDADAGSIIADSSNTNFYDVSYDDITTYSLTGGVNSGRPGATEYAAGFDEFEDVDAVEVDFLIAPEIGSRTTHKTVVNDMISIAENTRKDCVVVASPAKDDVVGLSARDAVDATVKAMNDLTFSSYAVFDNNYIKVYDKFSDKYRYIPAASSTAGIMAASDANSAPWFSPAGQRRGRYFGITDIAYSPSKTQRDSLYNAAINPIANIPGQGVLLYGDKTHLNRVSAFDRINVRRLFLILERAIGRAAQSTLFELNDEFTRAEFVNIVEPVLRNVKGRRGITDFRVVCDETNNTPDVIDRNEFIASVFIKPARSINYITLNFVGVRTGVDFEEVVGTV